VELSVQRIGYAHHGVLTDRHLYGLQPTVISNSKKHGRVVEELLVDFAGGAPVTVHNSPSEQPWWQTVQNAYSKLGEPYRLLDSNCEHFVRSCQGLPPQSQQLAIALCAALGGAALWALAA
jgi:hypothetical protein